jgi:hypothetical protein
MLRCKNSGLPRASRSVHIGAKELSITLTGAAKTAYLPAGRCALQQQKGQMLPRPKEGNGK